MPAIVFVRSNGERVEIEGLKGQSIMEAALNNGVDEILAECGGCMSCATCHIYVAPAWMDKIPPADDLETSLVACAVEPNEYSRLSCQIQVTEAIDGIIIHLPESQN